VELVEQRRVGCKKVILGLWTHLTEMPIKKKVKIHYCCKLKNEFLHFNGKESTVNRALGGSTYPG
jgi:hypothetical protein